MARSIEIPDWPDAAVVAVSLTFDVDGDPVVRGMDPQAARRPSLISQARYGMVRGLPRLLELLRDRALPATFYVPGATAAAYPNAIREIAAAGHEIGHHGHDHLNPGTIDATGQREEIERGLDALGEVVGHAPRGYRAPFFELTTETLALLLEHGFEYDSSCMGDDRPYVDGVGELSILELPVNWSLVDGCYFRYTLAHPGQLRNPDEALSIWRSEFTAAVKERRHVTYVMHPEIIGRAPELAALERFLDDIADEADVWFATHSDVAARVEVAA